MFSGERSRQPRYASIDVSIPPDARRKVGDVQWPGSVPGNPATDFVTTRVEQAEGPAASGADGGAGAPVPEPAANR